MNPITYTEKPIFFKRNRVKRVYEGGKLFENFSGEEEEDGNYPEEWLASCVKALNKECNNPEEGLSVIRGTDITLKSLIQDYPQKVLGEQQDLVYLSIKKWSNYYFKKGPLLFVINPCHCFFITMADLSRNIHNMRLVS